MFVGRETPLAQLSELRGVRSASLVVVTGRRRVGKSRLIREFAKGSPRFLEFSGLAPQKGIGPREQREEFLRQLTNQLNIPPIKTEDWGDIFQYLARQIEQGEVVVLLDELSWIAADDPLVLAKLKTAWDLHFSRNRQLILILCSSVSSWIEDNLVSSSGFAGRLSLHLRLKELPVNLCAQFWGKQRPRISHREILLLLGITGGVPRYLEEINPSESAEQNILRICFRDGSFLVEEFERLFSELFTRRAPGLSELVRTLADGPLSFSQLALKRAKRGAPSTDGGSLTKQLETLVACGFASRDYTWHLKSGEISKLSCYRLSDNYLRFYLRYIAKYRHRIAAGMFPDRSLSSLPNWDATMGLQFENTVLFSRKRVFEMLNLTLESIVNDSPYFQTATKTRPGCQIDYLIQCRFNTVYLCEIKFSRNPIGKSVLSEVSRKIKHLALPKNFSIRPVLIHAGDETDVTHEVRESGFFDRIISGRDLVG